ncbi:uncharacterized protein BO97DRAFT_12796 [Aspergillus homomorphus CBS 101889]|uniref:Uncharacterized protein n=1 Tax=Aspergillus homomorphus (strain CBS 101889) TaxID=1450537 RepID=A0A395IHK8_ASPHC|nr:hypothetical protein BO97DRAFT_12796 [Aspergillus homomorphus CBS 101889]RAL17704.1 hypothetical protein BO97DRAFT_12796 [Aspergillus homomorphus CBS 101889]
MFNPNIHGPPPGHDQHDPIILDEDDPDQFDQRYDSDTDSDNGRDRTPAHVIAQHQLSQLQGLDLDRAFPFPSDQPASNSSSVPESISTTSTVNDSNCNISFYQASLEQDKKLRSRLREERHAALCVLMDRELLTIQALAAQETIPQTRRRFLAKLLSPEDPENAATLRGERFIIQHPMLGGSRSGSASPAGRRMGVGVLDGIGIGVVGGPGSTTGLIVQRQVEDVCEADDAGWRRPPAERGGGTNRGSPAGSLSSSSGRVKGSSSVAATAGSTPERKGRPIKGRSQRERERERVRRGLAGAGAGLGSSIF